MHMKKHYLTVSVALCLAVSTASAQTTIETHPDGVTNTSEFSSDFQPAQDPAAATSQLLRLNEVQADGIYESGERSPFSKLRKVFVAKGSDGYFQKMLQSDHVVVRAMAMDCLVHTQGAKSIPIIKSRLANRALVHYQAGCVGEIVTEGTLALDFLLYSNLPDLKATSQHSYSPEDGRLLDKGARLALALEVLARNDAAAMNDRAIQAAVDELAIPGTQQSIWATTEPTCGPLAMASLKQKAPALSDATIVKALGRNKPCPAVMAFLLECVTDAGLDGQARLAAASALTRYAEAKAQQTLLSQKEALNQLEPGAGTQLCKEMEIRRRLEKEMAPIREMWTDWEKKKGPTVAVLKGYDHPMALIDCRGMDKDIAQYWAKAVLRISDSLCANVQPWNTYGDIPYQLEFWLKTAEFAEVRDKGSPTYVNSIKAILSQQEYHRLLHNIQAAIKAQESSAGH